MPTIRPTVKVKMDTKGLTELRKKLKTQKDKIVEVGHFGGKQHNDDDETIAGISLINQQGFTLPNGRKVPSRPYMEIALESPAFLTKYEESLKKIARGESTISKELPKLGNILKEVMQGVIDTGFRLTPNAPETIEKKGSNKPLIDTHTLVNDIESKIKRDLSRRKDTGISKVAR